MADTRRVHRVTKPNTTKSDLNDYSDPYSYSSKSKFKPTSLTVTKSSRSVQDDNSTKKRQVLIGKLSRSNSRSPTHRTKSNRNKSPSRSLSRGRTVVKTISPLQSSFSHYNRSRTNLIIRTPRSPTPRSRTPPTQRNRSREKSWSKSRSRTRSRSKNKDEKSKLKSKKSSKSDEKVTTKEKDKSTLSSKDKSSIKEKEKEKSSSTKDKDLKKSTTTSIKQSVSSKDQKSSTKSSTYKSSNTKDLKQRSPSPNKSKSSYLKSSVTSTTTNKTKNERKPDLANELRRKKKSLSRSPRSRTASSDKNYTDDYHNKSRGSSAALSRSRSRTRSRSSSNEHGYSHRNKSKYAANGRRQSPLYPKKPYPASRGARPPYTNPDDAELSGEENYDAQHPAMYNRYGRPYPGRYDPNMIPPPYMPNNRNQFYPGMPPPPHMHSYMGPKYGKFNKKFYPNMGPQMEFNGETAGNYDGPQPYPHHFMPRFPNYRYLGNNFNPNFNGHHNYQPHPMHMKPGQPFPKNKTDLEQSEQIEPEAATTSPTSTIVIDPELVNAVTEITTAMANATAAGKEMSLTAEQQALLQKHQQLVGQQNAQLQSQANALLNPLAKSKFPNYRLLGRNIFEPNKNQFVPKKRVKENTYYSRFIKQHPTNNLPLAFQKSVSLAEDKALEEKENQQTVSKKTKKKRSKKKKTTSDSSGSESDSSSSTSSSTGSSSSSSSSSYNSSTSSNSDSASSDGEIKKTNGDLTDKKKKKLKKKSPVVTPAIEALNELALNGDQIKKRDQSISSTSSKSSNLSSSSGEIKPDKKITKKSKKPKSKKTKTTKRKKHSLLNSANFNDNNPDYDSDGSQLDLKENLRPIGAYIKDRERMLIEMFRCIKGAKLQAMLPDVLKKRPLKEIRARCLEELDIISKKRIRCLLDDKQMTSSSGTDDSSDESEISFKLATKINTSQDNIQEESKPKQKTVRNGTTAASKFKPIGFGEVKSDQKRLSKDENEEEEDENNSQENDSNDLNQTEVNQTAQANQKQQPSGIAAAGFKQFVKKSISIKIKTNEASSSGATDAPEKDEKSERDKANNLLVQKHHISKINKSKNFNLIGSSSNPTTNQIKDEQDFANEFDQQKQQPQPNLSEAEKLRAQYNQYSKTQQQLNPKYNQQQYPHQHSSLLPTPTIRAPHSYMNQQQNQVSGYLATPPPSFGIPPPSFAIPPPNINPRFHLQQPPPVIHSGHSINGPPPSHLHQMPPNQMPPNQMQHHQQHPINNQNYQMMQNNSMPYNPYQYQQHQQQHQQQQHQQQGLMHHQLQNNTQQQQQLQLNNKPKHPYIHEDDFEDENINVNDDAAYDLDDYYNDHNVLCEDLVDPKQNKSNNTVDYDYNYDLELDNLNDLIGSSKKEPNRHRKHNRHGRRSHDHISDEDLSDDDSESILLELKSKSKRRKQSSKSKSKQKRSKRKHLDSDEEDEEDEEEDVNGPNIDALKEMLINVLQSQIDDNENDIDEEIKLTLSGLLSQVQEDTGSLTYEDLSNIHLTVKKLLTGETSDQTEDDQKLRRKKKRSKQRSHSKDFDSDLDDDEDKLKNKAPYKKKRRFQDDKKRDKSNRDTLYSNAEVEAGEIDDVYDDKFVVEDEFQDLLMNKRR